VGKEQWAKSSGQRAVGEEQLAKGQLAKSSWQKGSKLSQLTEIK